MADPTLVFPSDRDEREIVVNFGLYSGREATPAEVERLAETLLQKLWAVEIVCENRYEFDREREGTVYQVKVELTPADAPLRKSLLDTVERWARDCIAERRAMTV